MDRRDTIAMLTWINQVDPRVMLNEAAAETWAYAMSNINTADAKQAVLEHYKLHDDIAATPSAIRKRANNHQASREGRSNALEAKPRAPKHPMSFRALDPERWDRLYQAGVAAGNGERAYNTTIRATGDRRQAQVAQREAEAAA
jgi:hypothetical protein